MANCLFYELLYVFRMCVIIWPWLTLTKQTSAEESSKCITKIICNQDSSHKILEETFSWLYELLGPDIKFHFEAPWIALYVKRHLTQYYLGISGCHNNHTWCTSFSCDRDKLLLEKSIHSYFNRQFGFYEYSSCFRKCKWKRGWNILSNANLFLPKAQVKILGYKNT